MLWRIGEERSMRFTIITPTYNQAAFIADTIESVLNQRFKDFEYLIFDSESDDGTEEIVRSYEQKDPRIIYVREKDSGQANAINKGLRMAKGEIVCWLNSDDFFYNRNVLTHVDRIFRAKEDVGVVVGDAWYCDKEKNLTEYNESDRKVPDWVLGRWYYIVQPSVFWKNMGRLLDESYHYAFDWKFFAAMFGDEKVYYSHKPYSVYRMYEDNKTGQDNAKRRYEIYRLMKERDDSRANTVWCYFVYRVYDAAEKKNKPQWKKGIDFCTRVLFHVSGKRIAGF